MKIHYKQSVKAKIDLAIDHPLEDNDIEYFELTKDEYIQFLEELGITSYLVICKQFKTYRGYIIKVLP